jgi:uncharacterized membrane protein (DUF2068 family)
VKRPIGVVVSAVLLVLISLFQLLMAFLMAFAGLVHPNRNPALAHPDATAAIPFQPWMLIFLFGLCASFLALAVWGIATLVGLLKMRRWARYSMLVIGGGMALVGLFSLLAMLAAMAVPLPTPPGTNAAHAHTAQAIARMAFGAIAAFYGLLLGLGVFWLVYFNRKPVREAFAQTPGRFLQERRPFVISIFAVLSLLGAAVGLLAAVVPLPAAFFGFVVHGSGRAAGYLIYAVLEGAAGFGLWRMEEWGRLVKLATVGLGVINCVIWLVLEVMDPGRMLRYSAEFNRGLNLPPQPQLQGHFPTMFSAVILGLAILFMAAIMGVLHYYRGRFAGPAGPSDAGALEIA